MNIRTDGKKLLAVRQTTETYNHLDWRQRTTTESPDRAMNKQTYILKIAISKHDFKTLDSDNDKTRATNREISEENDAHL